MRHKVEEEPTSGVVKVKDASPIELHNDTGADETQPTTSLPEAKSNLSEDPGQQQTSLALYGPRLWLLLAVLCLSIYLLALELTMLSTVIPTLTNEFGTVADISWYEAAYVLPL